MKTAYNKYLYGGFVLFGLYLLFLRQEYSDASIYLGIALAFDPFDPELPWGKRPWGQRVWLVVHVLVMFYLFMRYSFFGQIP